MGIVNRSRNATQHTTDFDTTAADHSRVALGKFAALAALDLFAVVVLWRLFAMPRSVLAAGGKPTC